MKFLIIILILFSSFNSFAEISEKFNFDEMNLTDSSPLKVLSTKGAPEVPAKSFVVSSENRELSQYEIKKSWVKLKNNRNWTVSKGQKCRCKDEVRSEEVFTDQFSAENNVSYLGDFRGKHLFKVTVPLVKIEGKDQYFLENFDFKAKKLDLFSRENIDFKTRKMVIVLPEEFDSAKTLIKKYYGSKFHSVDFVNDNRVINDRRLLSGYLKDLYRESEVSHVLFVGNSNYVPTYYVDTKFDSVTPSDYPYFVMGGEKDLVPDIISSRWSVSSVEQIEGFLYKIEHRRKTNSPISLGVSSNEGHNPSDREYVSSILGSISNDQNSVHLNQNDSESNSNTFLGLLNNGVDFFNYIGHGSGFSWPSFGKEVFVSELDNWLPSNTNPIVVDVACQNGKFNGRGYIGEKMILGHQKFDFKNGAAAYIGGSVDISWDPPAIFAQGISKSIKMNPSVEIGEAMFAGFFHLIELHHDIDDLVDHLEWTHLQGDPTASIR